MRLHTLYPLPPTGGRVFEPTQQPFDSPIELTQQLSESPPSKSSQDIPRLEIPLHTLIELVPKPDGKMAETRISVDVDSEQEIPTSPSAPTTGVWNAHTGTWSVPQLSSQLSVGAPVGGGVRFRPRVCTLHS